MRYAEFQRKPVDVPEFVAKAGARFRENDVYPICLECRQKVAPRLPEGPREPWFAHFPDQAQHCDIASGRAVNGWSSIGAAAVNQSRGRELRRYFLTHEATRAFALLTRVCSGTVVDFNVFINLIRRADGRGIWDFVGLEPWMMSFILPLLDNFEAERYAFHFTMRRGADNVALFNGSRALILDRVFTNSGVSMNGSGKCPNPLPVTPEALKKYGDASWMKASDGFVRKLINHLPE